MAMRRQLALYVLIGASGTALHYAVLAVLVHLGVEPVVGTTIGALAGALCNYALNRRFTFASNAEHSVALPRFLTVAALGIVLNGAVVQVGVALLHAPLPVTQVVATGLVLLFGFAANRSWTFSKDRHAKP